MFYKQAEQLFSGKLYFLQISFAHIHIWLFWPYLKQKQKQKKTESPYAVQACLIPAMQSSCLCLHFTKAEITDMDHHVLLPSFISAEKVSEGHRAFRKKPEITSGVFFTTEYKVSTSKCFFFPTECWCSSSFPFWTSGHNTKLGPRASLGSDIRQSKLWTCWSLYS